MVDFRRILRKKKPQGRSRSLVSRSPRRRLSEQISRRQLALLITSAVLLTFLVAGLEFQSIPEFQVGDIADRTIKAVHAFTVEDEIATTEKRLEATREVPVVFQLDLRVNSRLESELRSAFGYARRAIAEERRAIDLPGTALLPEKSYERLLNELKSSLPGLDQGRVLEICLRAAFNSELENQLVSILRSALARPGVVLTRDLLVRYRDRGIVLRNSVSGSSRDLIDPIRVRELDQAREDVRRRIAELTAIGERDRAPLLGLLESWLVPNLGFDETETRRAELAAQSDVDPVLIQVKRGRAIVRAGDEITLRDMLLLGALKQGKLPGRVIGRFAGVLLLMLFLQFAAWRYLDVSRKRLRPHVDYFLLFVVIQVASLFAVKAHFVLSDLVAASSTFRDLQDSTLFYFLGPFTLGAVLTALLINFNVSLFFGLFFSVLVALLTGDLRMLIYSLNGCLAAVFLLNQYRERSALMRAALLIGFLNVVTVLALRLYTEPREFSLGEFGWGSAFAFGSAIFAAMMASLILPILESSFGITTDVRLLELSNLNTPILRRLAIEAPGTYHHSIIVGTLAEAAAESISANALLVRVGAYYHDIGKLRKPDYYVENQIYGGNKHESLSPSMSSLILASHVKDGLALADDIRLAAEVRDMIPQHHGTRLMTFFFRKAVEAADDKSGAVNEKEFRYPGPKPQTREAAILMLADQVEAASRTLQDPSPGQVRSMIKRLIRSTIEDGQFDECDISVRALEQISNAFERVIVGMYHHRIEYPGFEFNSKIQPEALEEGERLQ